MKKSHLARFGAAVIAVGALGAGGLVASAPALADPVDVGIQTSSFYWDSVDTTTGAINDAQPQNAITSAYGWTSDAFDGVPDTFTLNQGGVTWNFVASESDTAISNGGKSVITMTGNSGSTFGAVVYQVKQTLTLEGNYAQWASDISDVSAVVDPANLAALVVDFQGNLGSDSASTFFAAGNTLVSNDGVNGYDPVIGYNLATDGTFTGWDVSDGEGWVAAQATGASTFDLTLVLADYEPCGGQAAATAYVSSIVATLPATMGASFDALGNCVSVAPLALTTGVEINQDLAVDYAAVSGSWIDGYFNSSNDIVASIEGLPAGLTSVVTRQEDGTFAATVSGTPTSGGSTTAALRFAQRYDDGEDSDYYEQLLTAPFVVSVVTPTPEPTPTPTPTPEPTVTPTPEPTVTPTPEPTSTATPTSTPTAPVANQAVSLVLNAAIGDVVAGQTVTVTASGLQRGAAYDLVLRSTPITLAAGVVDSIGAVALRPTIPAGLEAGAHSLTFTSTFADGTAAVSVIRFEIDARGALVDGSVVASGLASTGFNGGGIALGALLFAAAGVALTVGAGARRTKANIS